MKKFISSTTLAIFSLIPVFSYAAVAEYDSPVVKIKNPIDDNPSLEVFLNRIITWVLLLVGGLAILFLIWGGLQYITSAGNKDKAEQAKKTITYAVIGLIVIVLAKVIVSIVTGLPFSLGLTGK